MVDGLVKGFRRQILNSGNNMKKKLEQQRRREQKEGGISGGGGYLGQMVRTDFLTAQVGKREDEQPVECCRVQAPKTWRLY